MKTFRCTRILLAGVLFATMSHCCALAGQGLLNSPYEEVMAILGKPSTHDKGSLSGVEYDRYLFETRDWKTTVLFIDGKAQKFDTGKSDESPLSAEEKTAILERYDVPDTSSKVRGWRELSENHLIRNDGRVHAIKHLTTMTVFLDDLPHEFW
jgi:hypothetical protein